MNHAYRLIWNAPHQAWVVAPETARARGKSGRGNRGRSAALALALLAAPAAHALDPNALPTGGQITAGSGSIGQAGNTLTVNQDSQRLVAEFLGFNIGSQATVDVIQPDAGSAALFRVLGSDPSYLYGSLNANGQVFLLSPGGVVVGAGARVDVGGLVASSLSLSDADFLAGSYRFGNAGGAGDVLNQGDIHGRVVALIAPRVVNQGTIDTPAGSAVLAAGDRVSLDLAGDGLVRVSVEQAALDALAENQGLIRADGGLVVMTAQAAGDLLATVVNNAGIIQARGLAERNGRIVLDGGDTGVTRAGGTLDASHGQGVGGTLVVTGDKVLVDADARLDASGASGGGGIYVGGGWQGGDPDIRQARATVVMAGAVLDASATDAGDGGSVVAWSDIHDADSVTRAHGTFLARGGANGGNGGRIETSGHWLDTAGARGDAAAPRGRAGLWLFDPYSVTITSANANGSFTGGAWTPSGSGSSILNTDINALLEGGTSVTVSTGAAGGEIGDITVASAITKASGNSDVTLTLQAANSIVVDQAIGNTGGSGKLHVVLDADNDNGSRDGAGIILLNNAITTGGGNLQFGTGATLSLGGVTTKVGGDVYVGGAGALALNTGGGNVTVNGEMIIANTSGLAITTGNGNVSFGGLLNSGNSYASVAGATTWSTALSSAASGAGSGVGDTYLATITSRLENAVASRAVNYNTSWLGARRVVGIGTNTAWRWVGGPEGLQDGGNGLVFFTQNGSDTANGSGGTTTSGLYSNWNSGEPNNFGGANLATEAESALQFVGTLGQWNDLPKTGNSLNYYVRETNLAASPLTVNAGTGTVTFTGAVGGSKALASLDVTAATIAINGGAVTSEGVQTYAGNVTLGAASTTLTQTSANTHFAVQANKSITNATGANASLAIVTTGIIELGAGASIASSTGALDITLNADSDASNGGSVWVPEGTSLASNGGNIKIGGGASANSYATGFNLASGENNARYRGATLNGTVNAGGGNITVLGEGLASTNARGVSIGGAVSTSGSGTITITGVSHGASDGVALGDSALVDPNGSVAAVNGTVTITGTKDTTGHAINLSTAGSSVGTSGSGGVALTATNGNLRSDGSIQASGGGAITLRSDSLVLGASSVSGTGTLTVIPYTNGASIGIAGGAGTLAVSAANFSSNFANGFSQITVGNGTSGAITLGGATSFSDAIALVSGGAITLDAALSASGQNVTLTGAGVVSGNGNITASGLLLNGTGSYTLNTASGNSVATLAAANAAAINFKNSGSLTVGTVAGTNGVTASGNITLEANGASADLSLSRAVTTTSGTIVLAAGRDFLNGTASDTGIVPGSGRYLVYSASPAASTEAMTGYSKHYNQSYSAGATPGYAGSGNWFLYTLAPVVSVTPGGQTVTYSDALAAFTPGYSGFVDGDTSAVLSGTASFSVGGASSSTGHATAGSHDVSYTAGLSNSLGYQIQDAAGSTGELTVNAKGLDLSGLGAGNKTFDGGTGATLSGTAAITGGGTAPGDGRYLTGDTVSLTGTASGNFGDALPGTGKTVTVSGLGLGGADGANYSLNAYTTTADITGQDTSGIQSSVTATPTGVTGTSDNSGGTGGAGGELAIVPGSGAATPATVGGGELVSSNLGAPVPALPAAPEPGAMSLATAAGAQPVSLGVSGATTTLELGGEVAAEPRLSTLPVFLGTSPQGSYRVEDQGARLSITPAPSQAPSSAPSPDHAGAGIEFQLRQADGASVSATLAVTPEGVLVLRLPAGASEASPAMVLSALAVARERLGLAADRLKAVVILRQ